MSKNKKRLLSVLLAFAMLCSIVSPAWADVPRSEDGYYALGTDAHESVYLESIMIADNDVIGMVTDEWRSEKETMNILLKRLNELCGDLCGCLNKDLNDGAGGDFICLGWTGTTDPKNAITGLRLLEWDNDEPPTTYTEDGVTWKLVNQAILIEEEDSIDINLIEWFAYSYAISLVHTDAEWVYLYSDTAVDLNEGAGGDYIYMYYTKNSSYGPPISEVKFTEDDTITLNSYQDKIVRFGDGEWYDVNDGAGGDYIYLYTETDFQAVDILKLYELLKVAEVCWYDSEGRTDSALESAYYSGKATLEAWGNMKVYDHDISMATRVPSDIQALEKALAELSVNGTIGGSNGSDNNIGDADLRILMQIKDKIMVNGINISSDAAPIIVDNRAMVPIGVLPAMLGGTVDWDEATRTVTLNIDGEVFSMTIDQQISNFGTSVVVRDNHVYVPIRYVAEKLGANVEWIAATQQVLIEKWNKV